MTDGIFKCNDYYAFARAKEIISTQSETDFEWSVKLIGDYLFYVGIASQLKRENLYICNYDKNSILYIGGSTSQFDVWSYDVGHKCVTLIDYCQKSVQESTKSNRSVRRHTDHRKTKNLHSGPGPICVHVLVEDAKMINGDFLFFFCLRVSESIGSGP